jgi:hypothetical protein
MKSCLTLGRDHWLCITVCPEKRPRASSPCPEQDPVMVAGALASEPSLWSLSLADLGEKSLSLDSLVSVPDSSGNGELYQLYLWFQAQYPYISLCSFPLPRFLSHCSSLMAAGSWEQTALHSSTPLISLPWGLY